MNAQLGNGLKNIWFILMIVSGLIALGIGLSLFFIPLASFLSKTIYLGSLSAFISGFALAARQALKAAFENSLRDLLLELKDKNRDCLALNAPSSPPPTTTTSSSSSSYSSFIPSFSSQGANAESLMGMNSHALFAELKNEIRRTAEALDQTKEVIEKQKLQIAHAAKINSLGMMSMGISHEINNPLSIIYGKIAMLIRRIKNSNFQPQDALSDLQEIDQMVTRIGKIMRGLQLYTQASSRESLSQLDVRGVLVDTFQMIGESLRAKNIKVDLERGPMIFVDCKPSQLNEAFLNIIGNAIEAIERQPQPWLNIRININDELKVCEIYFIDSGHGIRDTVLPHIMTPFFSTKPTGTGAGLGLSTAKGIVEGHGGSLRYELVEEHTAFIVLLPYSYIMNPF